MLWHAFMGISNYHAANAKSMGYQWVIISELKISVARIGTKNTIGLLITIFYTEVNSTVPLIDTRLNLS